MKPYFSFVRRHHRFGSGPHIISAGLSFEDTKILVGRRMGSSRIALRTNFSHLCACRNWQVFQTYNPEATPSTDHLVIDRHESTLIASKVKAYMYTSTIWCVHFIPCMLIYVTLPHRALCPHRSVRLSLIFSILRIPSSIPLRRVTFAVAASFVLFWATMLGLQAWWCNSYTETLSGDAISPSCVVPTFFVVFEVTSEYPNKCLTNR